MRVRCEAAVAEKEAEETSDGGEKFEYQAEVRFPSSSFFLSLGCFTVV